MIQTFKCSVCHRVYPTGTTTLYKLSDHQEPICYPCTNRIDENQMKQRGAINLYLDYDKLILTNFSKSLHFKVEKMNVVKSNNNQVVRTVWFTFNNQVWKGVQYGQNPTTYCGGIPRTPPELPNIPGLFHRLSASLSHKTRRATPQPHTVSLLRFYK